MISLPCPTLPLMGSRYCQIYSFSVSWNFKDSSPEALLVPVIGIPIELCTLNMYRAQRMVDLDSELASVLFSRARIDSFGQQDLDSDADIVRKRKLQRMMAVRQLESGTKREEQIHHERDLQIIEAYRERIKAESISRMLSQAITTQHTLYATLGHAEFFEFSLKNPYSVQHTITIECEHPELSVIVNSREWKHFKNLTKTLTPLEEDMFHVEGGVQFPQIYLRPKETVYIPFKFQTFSADHSIAPQ
eukprot:g45149.t1